MSLKKMLGFLLIAFAVFFVMDAPAEAARLVQATTRTAGEVFGSAFDSLSTFIRSF
jgi:large-conductance mechanosensitive channel